MSYKIIWRVRVSLQLFSILHSLCSINMIKISSFFIVRRDIESSHGENGNEIGDRSINRRSKHRATRSVKFASESRRRASTEKGETIPHAYGSIAIMVTAIVDRKAV